MEGLSILINEKVVPYGQIRLMFQREKNPVTQQLFADDLIYCSLPSPHSALELDEDLASASGLSLSWHKSRVFLSGKAWTLDLSRVSWG